MTEPAIIKPRHLGRLAVFYGRQSTPAQVESNTGSTEYQRRQVQYARDWGWPEDRIRWFDDFGLTGAAAEHRPQYRKMRQLLQADEVGLVGVADMSRLGRDAIEVLTFLQACTDHEALIAVDGRITEPRESSAWLLSGIRALLSQFGALVISETVQRGIKGQLEAGKAVSHPPVGYEKGPDKEWLITSDLRVRAAISTIFRVYPQERSLRATVRRLLELHVEVPFRGPAGTIQFGKPNISRVYSLIRNPNYTSDYYYRRRTVNRMKPRDARGRRRMRWAEPHEVEIKKDHHDGYITREQGAEIQAIFRTNAWSKDHASIGHGHAIAQGLVRCSLHRRWLLKTHYKRGPRSGPRSYAYHCEGDFKMGGPQCRTVPGSRLDDAVLRAGLEILSPPRIDAVEATLKRFLADSRADQRHRELEAARLRQRVSDLQRKFEALEPDSFQVFKHVEGQLESATRDLIAIEGTDDDQRREMAREYASILAEAVQLAPDVPRIVSASTTTNRDRKELVRILVRAVFIDEWGTERLRVRISWNDQTPDTLIEVWLRAGIERLILELWEEGKESDEIARALNDAGIKTNRGNLWNRKSVCDFHRERSSRRWADRHRRRAEKLADGRSRPQGEQAPATAPTA